MYDNPSVSSKYGGSFVYSVGVGVSDGRKKNITVFCSYDCGLSSLNYCLSFISNSLSLSLTHTHKQTNKLHVNIRNIIRRIP